MALCAKFPEIKLHQVFQAKWKWKTSISSTESFVNPCCCVNVCGYLENIYLRSGSWTSDAVWFEKTDFWKWWFQPILIKFQNKDTCQFNNDFTCWFSKQIHGHKCLRLLSTRWIRGEHLDRRRQVWLLVTSPRSVHSAAVGRNNW